MGSRLYHTLGAYMTIKIPAVSKEQGFRSCGNPVCSNHKKTLSSSFCDKCGGTVVTLTKTISSHFDLSSFLCEDLGETLFECRQLFNIKTELHLVLPNRKNNKGIEISAYDDGFQAISPSQRTDDIGWFYETYQKEITILNEKFGEENIEVLWGIVSYSS